jgi:hypothetical protein
LQFWREATESWQLIGFQKSVTSASDVTKFTVNLNIWSKRIFKFLGGEGKPDGDDHHWHRRLGFLTPQNSDLWWTVSADSSEAMDEAIQLLERHALPELAQLATDVALRDLWLSGQSPGLTEQQRLIYLSTLLALIGPPEQLPIIKQQMRDIVERQPAPSLVAQLRRLEKV